ncbi:hypothetical protein ACFYYN_20120 [Streptomyces sp. NPDC001902]
MTTVIEPPPDRFAVPFEENAPVAGPTTAVARQLAGRGGAGARTPASAGSGRSPGRSPAASRAGGLAGLVAVPHLDVVLRAAAGAAFSGGL